MRAKDAWEIADEWLKTEWLPDLERAGKAHGFAGAYIMGSLASLPAEAEYKNRASDIDVALVVDPDAVPRDPRYPHGKFTLFRECQIQAILLPMTVLDSEETLLTMLGLGCNLRNGRILSDPMGRIQAAKEAVMASWGAPEWTARRLDRARTFAAQAMDEMANASDPISRLGAFTGGLMQIAGLPAIATGVTPTHRRCLVKAAPIMRDRGREDLYERLLGVVGALDKDVSDVEAIVSDALAALEVEQRYAAEGVDISAEFRATLPETTAAGAFDLVEDGWVREAILPALTFVSLSASAVARTGTPADVSELGRLATANLERVGITESSWQERVGLARDLTEEVGEWCAGLASAG